MLSIRVSRKSLLCAGAALGAVFALTGQAAAQSTAPAISQFPVVDRNSIDLTTGQPLLSDVEVSIGQPGQGGLSRAFVGPGQLDNLQGQITPAGASPSLNVTFGGVTNHFDYNPITMSYDPAVNDGSTLVSNGGGTWTYTLPDGTIVYFSGQYGVSVADPAVYQIVRPTGEQLNYHYTSYNSTCTTPCMRLQAVVSTLGYMIHYVYAGNPPSTGSQTLIKIVAMNLADDWCDPDQNVCNPSQAWPTVTFSGPGSGSGTLQATDSLNRITTYTFTNNKITQIARPSGRIEDISYDSTSGNLKSVTVGGGIWNYNIVTLQNGDRQITTTDPVQNVTTVIIDGGWNRVKSVTDGAGHTTTYNIDATTGRINSIVNPEGDTTSYQYDSRGNVLTLTQSPKPGSPNPNRVISYQYDPTCTNPKTCNQTHYVQENSPSVETDFTYDAATGLLATVTRPAAANGVRPTITYNAPTQVTASYYQALGLISPAPAPVSKVSGWSTCMTQSSCAGTTDQVVTSFAYDAGTPNNALPVSVTVKDGTGAVATTATTQFTYTAASDVNVTTGPLGSVQTTRNIYDAMRQLTGQIGVDPDGQGTGRPALATKVTYNGDGVPNAITTGTVPSQSDNDFNNNFTTLYADVRTVDTNDHITDERVNDASGTTQNYTQFAYYGNEQLKCVAVRMNPATFGSPPSDACTLGTAGSYGPDRITKYIYDAAGRSYQTIDAFGDTAQRTTQTLQYTPNGQLQYITDGNRNLSTLVYDGFDRLSKLEFPSPTTPGTSSTTDYIQNTYNDTTWNVDQLRLRDGTVVTNSYDWRHNMTAKNAPFTNYTYDNLDRLTSIASGGQTFTETYDALGRLTGETGPLGTVASTYDVAGRRTRLTLPGGYFATYDYDNSGAMIDAKEAGTTTLFTFGYDNADQVNSLTRHNGVNTTYGHDTISRLTSIIHTYPGLASGNNVTVAWSYDPAGGINTRALSNGAYQWGGSKASTTYANDGQNKLTAAGSTSFAYDGRGNMTNDGTRSYGYDAADRIASAGAVTLTHDPFGRLSKTVDGSTTTQFLYDGPNLVGVYDGNGNQGKRFVHGPGVNNPLLLEESGTAHYPLADERGSIMGMADINGNMLAINTYDEYGLPGSANYGDVQYTGQIWLPNAGVYDYKTRAYSPTWGRFLQPDSIGYAGGMNLYAYVGNDPINRRDPLGRIGANCDPDCPGAPQLPPNNTGLPDQAANGDRISGGIEGVTVVGRPVLHIDYTGVNFAQFFGAGLNFGNVGGGIEIGTAGNSTSTSRKTCQAARATGRMLVRRGTHLAIYGAAAAGAIAGLDALSEGALTPLAVPAGRLALGVAAAGSNGAVVGASMLARNGSPREAINIGLESAFDIPLAEGARPFMDMLIDPTLNAVEDLTGVAKDRPC